MMLFKYEAFYEWKNLGNYNLCIDASIGKEAVAELILDYMKRQNS